MKISKERLLQIIREEVELHEKNTLELDERSLEELSKEKGKKILDAAEEDMEGSEDDKEEKENLEEAGDSLKGLEVLYKKAERQGRDGFQAVVDAVKKTANDPQAVAGAVRNKIKGYKKRVKEEADVEEDQIIDPHSKEVVEPPEKSGKIEIKIR